MKYFISTLLLLSSTFSLGGESNETIDAEIREIEAEIQANEQKYNYGKNLKSLTEATELKEELKNYINSCLEEITAAENMAVARDAREGTALMNFSITPSGTIKNIKVIKSSGNHATDQAIHQAILNASPCIKFPATLENNTREISTTKNITYIKASR